MVPHDFLWPGESPQTQAPPGPPAPPAPPAPVPSSQVQRRPTRKRPLPGAVLQTPQPPRGFAPAVPDAR
eukprot:15477060-Alexandrium_andersonii.AAC.1